MHPFEPLASRRHAARSGRRLPAPGGVLLLLLALAACAESGTDPDDGARTAVGEIEGTVHLEGFSVPGLTLELGTDPVRRTGTDEVGSFRFPGVPEGTYVLDLEGESPDGTFASRRTSVSVAGGGRSTVAFEGVLRRESTVSGWILVDGDPIPGAFARLEGREVRESPTDAEGRFHFGALPRDTYLLRLAGVDPSRFDFPDPVVVLDVATADTLELRLTGVRIPRPPADPTLLELEAITPSRVRVTWHPVPEAEEYVLERSEVGAGWQEAFRVEGSVTEVEDGGLAPATRYTYQLRACNADGCSGSSPEVEIRTPDNPPAAPHAGVGEPLGPHSVRVTWISRSDNETRFRIRRSQDGGAWTSAGETGAAVETFTDSGLSAGMAYGYQVQACNDGGCSEFSETIPVTTLDVPPGPPGAIQAHAISGTLVRVSWTGADGNVEAYVVERWSSGGSWGPVASRPASANGHDDATVSPLTEYRYRILACNEAGCSEPSGEVAVTTPEAPPAVPTSVGASATGSREIRVQWSHGAGGATHFELRRSLQGNWDPPLQLQGNERTFVDGGVEPGTTYAYQVRACNGGGCSAYSAIASATTPGIAPASPQGVTATANSASEVTIGWTSGGGSVEEFRIERREGSGSWTLLESVPGVARSYLDDTVAPATTYGYRVSACNVAGCSVATGSGALTTPDAAPTPPTALTGTTVGPDRIDLVWQLTSGNETSVELHRREGASGWGLHASLGPGTEAHADEGVTAGTVYGYRVRACGSAGCSPYSAEVALTPSASVPAIPGGLAAVATGSSEIHVTWNPVPENAEEYRLDRRVGTGSWATLATVPVPSTDYTDTGLQAGQSYSYRVRACGGGACSDTSGSVTVVTPGEGFNLSVAGVHVNQVVQTFDGDVPLVAGRPGMLRVFVEANATNAATPDVEVRLFHGGTPVQTYTIPAPGPSVPTSVSGAAHVVAWHQVIPGSLVTSDLRILVTADPEDVYPESTTEDNVYPASGVPGAVEVRDVPSLDIRIVPVFQDSTGLTGAYFSGLMEDTRAMLPLGAVLEDVAPVYTTSQPPLQSGNENGAWSAILSEMHALRVAEGTGQHYYGLVRTDYTSGVAGMGYIGHPVSVGWDRTNSAGWIAAHELGHNFGRRHAPCPSDVNGRDSSYPHAGGYIGEVGFVNGSLVAPDSHRDLMSYCGPRWISDYNFEAILAYRGSGGIALTTTGAPRERALVLWGRIGPEGTVLEPAFEIETVPALPSGAGDYRLEGLGPEGRVLFSHPFEGVETGEEDGTRSFAFAVPMRTFPAEDLRGIRLLQGGVERERREAGRPELMFAGPVEETITAQRIPDGQTRIEWDANTHPLLVVRDPETGRILSLARGGVVRLPGAPAVELEAVVSDGVRSRSVFRRPE